MLVFQQAGHYTKNLLPRFCQEQQGCAARHQPCSVLQTFSKVILKVGISGKVGYNSIISYGFCYFCSSLRESKGRCLCAKSLQYNGIAACPFHSCMEFSSVFCCSDNWWRAVAMNKQFGSFNDEFQTLSDLRASPSITLLTTPLYKRNTHENNWKNQ